MTQQEWIFKVVNDFYQMAKTDVLIGYHFRIIEDFDVHIPRIATFWDLQLLGTSSRQLTEPFDVIRKHIPMGIKRGELGRWLVLFKKSLNQETEYLDLKNEWLKKLSFFEGIFQRFFGL